MRDCSRQDPDIAVRLELLNQLRIEEVSEMPKQPKPPFVYLCMVPGCVNERVSDEPWRHGNIVFCRWHQRQYDCCY
jgi:hypothetical protein